MPLYRLTTPGLPIEVLAADRLAREGQHLTLYGTALEIGRPREVVVRRCSPRRAWSSRSQSEPTPAQ